MPSKILKTDETLTSAIEQILVKHTTITDIDLEKILRTDYGFNTSGAQRWETISSSETLVNSIDPQKDLENRLVYLWKDKLMLLADRSSIDPIEREMFKLIHSAKSKGMKNNWLKAKLQITTRDCNRSLKKLEELSLITRVRLGKRIIFHRIDCELDESLIGGFWQTEDQKPDTQAISVARQLAAQCLSESYQRKSTNDQVLIPGYKSGCTVDEIREYIISKGVFHDKLKNSDVFTLMETMRFDDLVNLTEKRGTKIYFLVKNCYSEPIGYAHCPCSTCLVKEVCGDSGAINPQSCEYFKNWLDEF